MTVNSQPPDFPQLYKSTFTFPAIDNHAHPLLKSQHRSQFPFEGLISEAEGKALTQDSIHTLACLRATAQLRKIFKLEGASWDDIKVARKKIDYVDLCKMFLQPTGIQCILIDDGLGGVQKFAEDYIWHDQFTTSPTKRIARIEVIAEGILKEVLEPHLSSDALEVVLILDIFTQKLTASLASSATDAQVAAFKSIVCYRTGLDISTWSSPASMKLSLLDIFEMYKDEGKIRLAHKALNDHVVCVALQIAGRYNKPVQFHTGLGDNDITLVVSSPARLQPVIEAYPDTTFVLLHSSYPYTREAGYLTAVYSNVFLDIGEVFPIVSGQGQRSVIQQVLELCPTNKVMWSTDGHWWPESYYLGSIQARQALYTVLAETVRLHELTETEAIAIVQNVLFHNANRLYQLDLEPHPTVSF